MYFTFRMIIYIYIYISNFPLKFNPVSWKRILALCIISREEETRRRKRRSRRKRRRRNSFELPLCARTQGGESVCAPPADTQKDAQLIRSPPN